MPSPTIRLLAAIFSCFAGGTIYLLGIWTPDMKNDTGENQKVTDAFAGIVFTGGSAVTWLVMKMSWKVGWRITHCVCCFAGLLAYVVLGFSDAARTPAALIVCGLLLGIDIMGAFLVAMDMTVNLPESFIKPNVATAIIQSAYGLGNTLWPVFYFYVCGQDWQLLCKSLAGVKGLQLLVSVVGFNSFANDQAQQQQQQQQQASVASERDPLLASTVNDNSIVQVNNNNNNNNNDINNNDINNNDINNNNNNNKRSLWNYYKLLLLLSVVYFLFLGDSMTLLQNSGAILRSLGEEASSHKVMLLTMVFGIGHMGGKLVSGAYVGFVSTWPNWYIAVQTLLGCAILLGLHIAAYALAESVTAITVLIMLTGIPYALCWNSLFHLVNTLYPKDLLAVSVAMLISPGFGPLLINIMIGSIYDAKTESVSAGGGGSGNFTVMNHDESDNNNNNNNNANNCIGGAHCFGDSYICLAALDGLALILAVWMTRIIWSRRG